MKEYKYNNDNDIILVTDTKNDSTENKLFNGYGSLFREKIGTKKMFYDGYFKDGLYHGLGILTFENGNIYKGEFVNGLFHGSGTLTFKNGVIHQGNFKNGVFMDIITELSRDQTYDNTRYNLRDQKIIDVLKPKEDNDQTPDPYSLRAQITRDYLTYFMVKDTIICMRVFQVIFLDMPIEN